MKFGVEDSRRRSLLLDTPERGAYRVSKRGAWEPFFNLEEKEEEGLSIGFP